MQWDKIHDATRYKYQTRDGKRIVLLLVKSDLTHVFTAFTQRLYLPHLTCQVGVMQGIDARSRLRLVFKISVELVEMLRYIEQGIGIKSGRIGTNLILVIGIEHGVEPLNIVALQGSATAVLQLLRGIERCPHLGE